MAIRRFLYAGAIATALAAAGVGLTAGTASASANCTGYLSEAYGFQSLGLTNYSLGEGDYNAGDYSDATYFFNLSANYYRSASAMMDQYNRCNMEAP